MSRVKSWTRKAAQLRKDAAAEARAEQAERTARRRRLLLRLAGSVAGVALFTVLGALSLHSTAPSVLAMSAGSGSLLVAGVLAHGWLSRRVGRLTAILALALVGGVIFLALASLSSTCPGNTVVGRCTPGELADWSLVGMITPLTGALIVGLPLASGRGLWRVGGWLVRIWRGKPKP